MEHAWEALTERKTSIFDLFSLKGKKAMVIGALDGIGRSCAEAFAEAGADIALVVHSRDYELLERLSEDLFEQYETRPAVFCCDSPQRDRIDALRDEIRQEMGAPDVVHINTAVLMHEWADGSDEKKMLTATLKRVSHIAQAVIQLMQEEQRGGSLIFTFSTSGTDQEQNLHRQAPNELYQSVKTALFQYTRFLAALSAQKGIRVNTLCPGFLRMNGWRGESNPDHSGLVFQAESIEKNEKLQGVLLFLASDASSYITGAHIPIGGAALS